jgi:serine/threonine protein kinase
MSAAERDGLKKEVELASYLQHPTFLRILQTIFRKERCFIVDDFTDGETIARRIDTGTAFAVNDVIGILAQLCDATAEAHARGLQHLRIVPSEIYVQADQILGRQTARVSPINLKYFLERRRARDEMRFLDHIGPFMAPELWKGPDWFNERMGSTLEGEQLSQAMHQKANQFALGMVAWTMLEGRVPFAIPTVQSAWTKVQTFLDRSESFSENVLAASWRPQARALTRIIARMVAADPANRWADMRQVNLLVGDIASDRDANALEDAVKSTFRSVDQDEFYRRFYDNLFRRVPPLRQKFPSDMTRQHHLLRFALGQLLNYSQQQSEPTTLSQFVETHRRLDLTPADFEQFGEALVETFDSYLDDHDERARTLAALEIVIWPGIDYLVQKCTQTGTAARLERTGPIRGPRRAAARPRGAGPRKR